MTYWLLAEYEKLYTDHIFAQFILNECTLYIVKQSFN